jgi:hypothetical protein
MLGVSQCGEQAGDLLMQLSRTLERGDTQGAAAAAKQLLTLSDKVTTESSCAFGEWERLSFSHVPLKIMTCFPRA